MENEYEEVLRKVNELLESLPTDADREAIFMDTNYCKVCGKKWVLVKNPETGKTTVDCHCSQPNYKGQSYSFGEGDKE